MKVGLWVKSGNPGLMFGIFFGKIMLKHKDYIEMKSMCRGWLKKTFCCINIIILVLFLQCRYLFAAIYTDDFGREIQINKSPERIVSLAPHITEILFAIGLKDEVAGVTLFSDYPEGAKKKTIVGSYVNLNLEKIISLAPDLVISTADGNPKADIERLSSMGIPVFIISPARDIKGIMKAIPTIGRITSKYDASMQVVRAMERRLKNVRARLKGSEPRSVFYQLSVNPLMTAGKDTFVNSLIEMAGGKNIAGKLKTRYPRFSMEKVLAASPEVIIISSMADKKVSEGTMQGWERWKDIPAVRNGKIYFIDPDLINRPGPRIVEGLEKLAVMIHPERFHR